MFADKEHLVTQACIIIYIVGGGFTGPSSARWQQGTFIRQLVALAPQQSAAHVLLLCSSDFVM